MIDREEQLDNLVRQWMEVRGQRDSVTPAILCRNHPELLDDFCQRIAMLATMEWLNRPDVDDDSVPVDARYLADDWQGTLQMPTLLTRHV